MEIISGKPKLRVAGVDWYDAESLRDTELFKNRKTTRFSLADTHGLKQGIDFIYTAHSNVTEVKEERDNRSDRVLLSCAWVHDWLTGAKRRETTTGAARASKRPRVTDDEEESSEAEHGFDEPLDDEDIPKLLLSGLSMPARVGVEMLPPIQLEEEEWFMGYDISFRGERHPDYIYARGPDVARVLQIRLVLKGRKSVLSSNYITVYEGEKPVTYLRYCGLFALLFSVQKKGLARKFQSWAMRVLFAFQFRPAAGTSAARIPQSLCKPFFQISAGEVTGFFACWIQTVDALQNDIQIPVELSRGLGQGVYRIGFTANLPLEMTVLKNRFATLSSTVVDDLQLVSFAHIEPMLFSAAQRDWDALAIALRENYFQLFGFDWGLYVLHDCDLMKVKSIALQLRLRFSTGIVQHARLEVTNELVVAHQQEIERLRTQHEREMLEMQRQLQRRA